MLIIKRTTLLAINCYYGILVLAKNEAVLISIPRYTVFSIYRPTLVASTKLWRDACKKTKGKTFYLFIASSRWLVLSDGLKIDTIRSGMYRE